MKRGGQRNRLRLSAEHPRAGPLAPRVRRRALQFLRQLGLSGVELSVLLVGDRAIRELNRVWRGVPRPTDVLSFPAGAKPPGFPGPRLLGDVVISLETAARVAREEGRSVEEEVSRYLAHGLLHLLGHDHHRKGEALRMARIEARLLGGAGMVGSTSGSIDRMTCR